MFSEEQNDLFQDMKSLPHHSLMSKLNHIGKRTNTAIVRNDHILFYGSQLWLNGQNIHILMHEVPDLIPR